jgi:putative tricarboxylic transport membrane protein
MTTTDSSGPSPSSPEQPPAPQNHAGPAGTSGLSELVVPAILVAIAIFLIVGTASMTLPPSVQVPGPTFFPIIVICLLLLMAVLSTVQILLNRSRSRRLADDLHLDGSAPDLGHADSSGLDDVDLSPRSSLIDGPGRDADGDEVTEIPPVPPPGREPWPAKAFSDWRALGTVLGSLVLFIVLLRPAGWIIAAAVLFWGVSYALGSRRPVFDLSVALVMSSLIQLIFGSLLGLNLPAGFLAGVL